MVLFVRSPCHPGSIKRQGHQLATPLHNIIRATALAPPIESIRFIRRIAFVAAPARCDVLQPATPSCESAGDQARPHTAVHGVCTENAATDASRCSISGCGESAHVSHVFMKWTGGNRGERSRRGEVSGGCLTGRTCGFGRNADGAFMPRNGFVKNTVFTHFLVERSSGYPEPACSCALVAPACL